MPHLVKISKHAAAKLSKSSDVSISDKKNRTVAQLGDIQPHREINKRVDWDTQYKELIAYKEQHGHCNVSCYDKSNEELGKWVKYMRKAIKLGWLSEEKISKLNGLGFVWELQKHNTRVDWATRYKELIAYKEQYGHCNVSKKRDKLHKSLGIWVMQMRRDYKTGKLSADRKAKLNEIGFVWSMREHDSHFDLPTCNNEAFARKEQNDPCLVSKYDKSHLAETILSGDSSESGLFKENRVLGDLGSDQECKMRVDGITHCKDQADHCNVSRHDESDLVGSKLRGNPSDSTGKKENKVVAQLELLESGKEINKRVDWDTQYNELVLFKQKHGHCNVSCYDKSNEELGKWVKYMRKAIKLGWLSEEKISKLNGLGFVWELQKHNTRVDWATRYKELIAYKEQYGHCNVSKKRDKLHKSLGIWVMQMRRDYKTGKLSADRKAKLNEIGFIWRMAEK